MRYMTSLLDNVKGLKEVFNETEFEDAINMQLVKCQSYEDAERIHQIKFWFDVL